jgi:hypothetical protein
MVGRLFPQICNTRNKDRSRLGLAGLLLFWIAHNIHRIDDEAIKHLLSMIIGKAFVFCQVSLEHLE